MLNINSRIAAVTFIIAFQVVCLFQAFSFTYLISKSQHLKQGIGAAHSEGILVRNKDKLGGDFDRLSSVLIGVDNIQKNRIRELERLRGLEIIKTLLSFGALYYFLKIRRENSTLNKKE